MRRRRAVILGLGGYVVWASATYLLEGRPLTLLRPEAVTLRLTYALIVNLLLGTILALALVKNIFLGTALSRRQAGLSGLPRTVVSVLAAAVLGFTIYLAQGAPSLVPLILLNGFAQVLVVSVAEILVCWVVVGGAVQIALHRHPGYIRVGATLLISAALFGLYHFAHSPPFNTWGMVGLLSVVGIGTGAFFLVSRDLYGTIVFHNFLALFGVLNTVQQSIGLESYTRVQWPLLLTAGVAIAALVVFDVSYVRKPGSMDPL